MSGGPDRPFALQSVGDDEAAFYDPESGGVCELVVQK